MTAVVRHSLPVITGVLVAEVIEVMDPFTALAGDVLLRLVAGTAEVAEAKEVFKK